jgi:hypothetical protein
MTMDDEQPPQPESPGPPPPAEPAAAPAAPPKRKRWYHRWKLIVTGLLVTPMLLFVLYTFIALKWSYSTGDRAGTLQKLSKKGWLCKTWEGELMQPTAPGVAPVIWNFSVRSDSLAQVINAGMGKRVVLQYQEHRGVPTDCFGATDYFVTGIRIEP